MIAVTTARGGRAAGGSEEAVAEAGGRGLVAGEGALGAALALRRPSQPGAGDEPAELWALELGGGFGPARFAETIAPHVASEGAVILPASPDGRDLAPRLARVLDYPLLAGALAVTPEGAVLARRDGRQLATVRVEGPFVATLLPGSGGAPWNGPEEAAPAARDGRGEAAAGGRRPVVELEASPAPLSVRDPELLEVTPPDAATVGLSEAARIVAAGGGLGGRGHVALLEEVAAQLEASSGATRVVTDAGWLGHDRQIGTTGVSVHPRCYLAFGISGAAQHVAGLGTPRHVVAVNRDRSCPMMAMADLALVTDAPALVEALARHLARLAVASHGVEA